MPLFVAYEATSRTLCLRGLRGSRGKKLNMGICRIIQNYITKFAIVFNRS